MTAKTKSERFRRLLSHGYFAPELPPCFVSNDLAKYRKYIIENIDTLPLIRGKPAFHRFISEPTWFYYPRHGRDDRRHGVLNPISHLLIAKVVADNFIKLRNCTKSSKISASPPIFDWAGSRSLMRASIDLRDDFRVDLSSRREAYVSADIRSFFHSIYTHAIPWAIYGKDWAKSNRDTVHYGNLIDLLCRNCQDGQTIGLPVGPDTSRLIAEVVASAVDCQLRERLNLTSSDASRYIDDYTISSPSGHSGEELIATLRQCVAHFELELNNEKTAIHNTSTRHNTGWKQAVRSYIPRGPSDASAFQQFFYQVGNICDMHPEINVEKYALQNARTAFMRASEWRKIQSHLINAYRRNPSIIAFLVEILLLRQVQKRDVDIGNVRDFIANRIPVLARGNRTGELIWLLFLAIRLQITLSADHLEPLFDIENSLVALLVIYARGIGGVQGNVDTRVWDRSLSHDGLQSGMWLYAYEGVERGLVPGANSTFITDNEYFKLLQIKKVRFLAIETGLSSMATLLRNLRGDNSRTRRVREDFFDDFSIDLDEFEDDDDLNEVEY